MTFWRSVVVGCAVLLAGCANAPQAPTQPSGPSTQPGLPAPQLTVRVDSHNSAVAIVGVSEVSFDARGTPGDKLRYELQFGDGGSATTPLATHVYTTTGTFTATLTVIDAADQRSSMSATVTVKAVTGTWFYSDYNERSRRAEVHRVAIEAHNGDTVGGLYSTPDKPDTAIAGTLRADRSIRLVAADGSVTFEGLVSDNVESDWSLTAQGGRINGQALPFRYVANTAAGPAPTARLAVRFDSTRAVNLGRRPVMGLTPIEFDAADSTGDASIYLLEFGDGEYTRDSRAVHAAMKTGLLTARVIVIDRFGRFASATQHFGPITSFVNASLEKWANTLMNPRTGSLEFRTLWFTSHERRAVAGFYKHPDGAISPFEGTFDGAGGIEITLIGGGITFKGTLVRNPNASFYSDLQLSLRGGSADGMTLTFLFDDGPG